MTVKTNFLPFNEEMSSDLTMSDSNYSMATQRLRGVTPGIASPQLHNKLFRQISAMSVGIAYWVNEYGYDCYDYDIPGIKNNFDLALAKKITVEIDNHNGDLDAHKTIINSAVDDHDANRDAHGGIGQQFKEHNGDTEAHANGISGNAASATSATKDSDGNNINTTYSKKATFASDVISALASKTLSSLGVAYSMGSTGYVAFGDLFGGLIIQWGLSFVSATVFPVNFKKAYQIVATDGGAGKVPVGCENTDAKYATIYSTNVRARWIAIGS